MTGIGRAQSLDRFDRLALSAILLLIAAIGVVGGLGDRVTRKVDNFSWQDRKIGVRDRSFTVTFNRPVDRASVEKNLTVTPPLPGKMSWSGDRLTYTLTELPTYGKQYEVKLPIANGEPFVGQFASRDRAFAYIGVSGEERGRLVLATIPSGTDKAKKLPKTILTPADLVVTDFRIYPSGDKILFSAFDLGSLGREVPKQQLYTVRTGLNQGENGQDSRAGRLEVLLDAKTYQNLRFDLSEDGSTLVVQRVNHQNPGDASLWVMDEEGNSRPLGVRGDNFLVSPDGSRALVSQEGGVAVIPLRENAGSPRFLTTYERGLGFSRDSRDQLMVRLDPDNGRSLYLLNDKGESKLLLRTLNPIISCQFEPKTEQTLYCLKSDLVPASDGTLREEPLLSIIDVKTAKETPFLALPNYRDVQMGISPDGVGLLFDQVVTAPFGVRQDLVTGDGSVIADGRIWLLPLPDRVNPGTLPKILPEELNPGFRPRWLP
ncbi:hypothetical protein V0288_06670 [Pannus brasiliensis CCIBt3594]|uniref:SbsA Ig-like domain-containing protein n=1 Tax=Pannus brasiliensis CCIBt3594 TaxID=1427578 RepID=A0AAW9QVW2_9CHRO